MPEDMLKAGEQKVESLIKSQPAYVWAGGAVGAGLILFYIIRRRQAAANAASTSGTQSGSALTDGAQLNGFQVDQMAGLPYGTDSTGYNYQSGPVDNFPGGSYSEVGVNGNNVPIVPSGVNPIYDSNGTLVGFQSPGQQPTQSPNPTPVPTQPPVPTPAQTETGTIRQRMTSGVTATYDKPNPGGVPFRVSPGGTVLHTVPYGSQVTIAGTPVQGPDNFGKSDTTHAGSSLWFPVQVGSTKGYVSAYDIVNVLTGQGSGGMPEDTGGFHLPVNAGRNTIDQWTFSNGMHQDFHSFANIGLD